MSTPVSILPPPKHNKFSLNLIRTSVAALVAVAFMGWGSSYAQLITSSPGGVSGALPQKKAGSGAAKNEQATEELLLVAQEGWCPLQAEEGEAVSKDARRLLAAGADINATGEDGRTVLMHAVRAWEYGTAKFLIDRGADINAADDGGLTVLMWALMSGGSCPAMKGFMGVDARSVRLLLEKGANPKAVAKGGETALSIAKGDKRLTRMVKAAIANYGSGKKLDLSSVFEAEAALMQAVKKDDVAAVQRMLEKDAEADVNRALLLAKNERMIELLLRHGADIDYRNGNPHPYQDVDPYPDGNLMSQAVEAGDVARVKFLVKHGAKISGEDGAGVQDFLAGYSLLGYAAGKGDINMVKALIEAGADVREDACLGMGCGGSQSLLQVAQEPFDGAAKENQKEIIRILKAAGAKEKPADD